MDVYIPFIYNANLQENNNKCKTEFQSEFSELSSQVTTLMY